MVLLSQATPEVQCSLKQFTPYNQRVNKLFSQLMFACTQGVKTKQGPPMLIFIFVHLFSYLNLAELLMGGYLGKKNTWQIVWLPPRDRLASNWVLTNIDNTSDNGHEPSFWATFWVKVKLIWQSIAGMLANTIGIKALWDTSILRHFALLRTAWGPDSAGLSQWSGSRTRPTFCQNVILFCRTGSDRQCRLRA